MEAFCAFRSEMVIVVGPEFTLELLLYTTGGTGGRLGLGVALPVRRTISKKVGGS